MRHREWWRHRRTAKPPRVVPWGPFCWLHCGPHPAPFSKRTAGRRRRTERRWRLREKEPCVRSRDQLSFVYRGEKT